MIWIIIHIVEILLWILLAVSGAYILFFALVSMLWKKPVSPLSAYLSEKKQSSICILSVFPKRLGRVIRVTVSLFSHHSFMKRDLST